jgi:hypothetical protein
MWDGARRRRAPALKLLKAAFTMEKTITDATREHFLQLCKAEGTLGLGLASSVESMRLFLAAFLLSSAAAYPNYVGCTRDLSTSGSIMGRPITESSAASVVAKDSLGNVVNSVSPGQVLSLTFSGWSSLSPYPNYMVLRAQCAKDQLGNVVACGKFSAASPGFNINCDTQLYASGPASGTATFTANATAGGVEFRVVWAGGYGQPVSMTRVPLTGATSPCKAYCDLTETNCGAFGSTNNKYADEAACLDACAYFPASSKIGAASAVLNSLQCRTYHAGAPAAFDAAIHCPHAMADGGGACGTKCAAYCDRAMANCNGSNAIYGSRSLCEASCVAFPAGTLADVGGNTLGCRFYHASAARLNPSLHCPHASVDGGGVCGADKCTAYCNQMTANCGTVFASNAACVAACALYPDVPSRATGGNSVQCRTYHATVAATDVAGGSAATHCPHAAAVSGGGVCGTATNVCQGADAMCQMCAKDYATNQGCCDHFKGQGKGCSWGPIVGTAPSPSGSGGSGNTTNTTSPTPALTPYPLARQGGGRCAHPVTNIGQCPAAQSSLSLDGYPSGCFFYQADGGSGGTAYFNKPPNGYGTECSSSNECLCYPQMASSYPPTLPRPTTVNGQMAFSSPGSSGGSYGHRDLTSSYRSSGGSHGHRDLTSSYPATVAKQFACLESGCPSVRMVGDGVCDPACQTPACLGDGNDCKSTQNSAYGPVTRSDSNQNPYDPYNRYFPAPYILTKKTVCTGVQTWDGKLAAGGQALSPARKAGTDLTPTAAVPASDQASRNRKSAACLKLHLLFCRHAY